MNDEQCNEKIAEIRDKLATNVNPMRRHGIAKVLDFHEAFVTCLTCSVCYDDKGLPTFCQYLCAVVNPRAIRDNMERAAACPKWWPECIPRIDSGAVYKAE